MSKNQSPLSLSRLSYAELSTRLDAEPTETLIPLLNERSIKVGDTAIEILGRRHKYAIVLGALMAGTLTTRNGKVRALNLFLRRGRSMPEALSAYLQFIHDANRDVVSCALFGVVFWNDPAHLAAVRSITNARASDLREVAIAALQARNPSLYSPGFFDLNGVWSTVPLDRRRGEDR